MTTIAALRDLAGILVSMRPEWDLIATQNHLARHQQLDIDILAAAAIRLASDTSNRTPASLQWLNTAPRQTPERTNEHQEGPQPKCYICGRTQTRCDQLYAKEVRLGTPNPHRYQPAEAAEAQAVGRQLTAPITGPVIAGPDPAPRKPKAWRR